MITQKMHSPKTIHLIYFAILKDLSKKNEETLSTMANTAIELYLEIKQKYNLEYTPDILKVAINDQFKPWDTFLADQDTVVFIMPVSGGAHV